MSETINVYIGWDSREPQAAEVCRHSIVKNASIPVNIIFLKREELVRRGVYNKEDYDANTEYTYTRYLVPYLNDFQGLAVYCDGDTVWDSDIAELVALANKDHAVSVAKHDYHPQPGIKLDGRPQIPYPRKNWSSVALWNCKHPANAKLMPKIVDERPGSYLHAFSWLRDSQIGEISHHWNWLVGWHRLIKDGCPKVIHYTEGGPWIPKYATCELSSVWTEYRDSLNIEQAQQREVFTIGHVTLPENTRKLLLDFLNFASDPYKRYFDVDPSKIYQPMNISMGRLENLPPVIGMVSDGERELDDDERVEVDPVLHSFILGCQGMVADYHDPVVRHSTVPLALRGITKRKIIWECEKIKRDYYYIDSGYFGNTKTKLYHRITKNSLQWQGELDGRCPDDRWRRINQTILPRSPGSKVLICPPSAKAMMFWNLDLDDWIKNVVVEIKKHTDREIVIRNKPSRRDRTSGIDSLENALADDVHCLVTFNSIAAVEALLLGKPVFTLGPNAALPMANVDLSMIDDPWMPSVDEVRVLCVNLAYNQFTNNELRDGTAWRMLNNA